MTWKDAIRPDFLYDYFFQKRLQGMLGDGDAIVLIPYSDGVLWPKRAYYEKHLVGNMAGYQTDDGDVFVAEGWGNPKMNFAGVPVVLAVNPSEHSAVVEPFKSLLAHKRDLGQFVRVDQQGEAVELGPAIADDGDADIPTATDTPTDINYDVYDGLFDVTPPGIVATGEDGEPLTDESGDPVLVDQADGWIVSQQKAADLVPAKTSSSELKLMQQRERNAMADTQELFKYLVYGAVMASILWLVFFVLFAIGTGSMPGIV